MKYNYHIPSPLSTSIHPESTPASHSRPKAPTPSYPIPPSSPRLEKNLHLLPSLFSPLLISNQNTNPKPPFNIPPINSRSPLYPKPILAYALYIPFQYSTHFFTSLYLRRVAQSTCCRSKIPDDREKKFSYTQEYDEAWGSIYLG